MSSALCGPKHRWCDAADKLALLLVLCRAMFNNLMTEVHVYAQRGTNWGFRITGLDGASVEGVWFNPESCRQEGQ